MYRVGFTNADSNGLISATEFNKLVTSNSFEGAYEYAIALVKDYGSDLRIAYIEEEARVETA